VYQVSWPSFVAAAINALSWWRCRTQRRGIDKRQCGCALEKSYGAKSDGS
jgi:hypothetical protein